jgi:prepilin-type N-terminal cleavage/methylation domain-containing protein
MAPPDQHGMTLIELMIVVAIVGILATVAVFMFTKSTAKARASEVPAVFAEFRIKQEQFHMENGVYQSTGDEGTPGDYWPVSPATPSSGGNAIDPLPATWQALRMTLDKSALYCSYITVGQTANAGPGAIASSYGFTAAPVNYFYSIANCDLDGKSAVNSQYFSISTTDGLLVDNEGR